jgi:outer membrane lipoprotein SlyB
MMKYSRQWFGCSVLLAVFLLHGCATVPADAAVAYSVTTTDSRPINTQWVRFGVLLVVQPIGLTDSEGREESAMRMEVVLDDGRSVVVEQPLSQAGELNVGDRVRLLRIGDFSQVTFWPYQKGADRAVE